jgi:spore coat polysaccharide biosynthesis protein SpsF (cytidylyltransferase family)
MSINAIITARYNSRRLPGKSLIDINGKPLLQHMVDRLQSSKFIDRMIISTSTDSEEIIKYCSDNEIDCFHYPDEDDCLTRLIRTVRKFESDYVVRLYGDSPLINTSLIEYALSCDGDMVYPAGFPKGWDFQLFKTNSFLNLCASMTDIEKFHWNENEELTCWASQGFKTYCIQNITDQSHINYSVDYQGDVERISRILCSLKK